MTVSGNTILADASPEIAITIDAEAWGAALADCRAIVRIAAHAAAVAGHAAGHVYAGPVEISILLADDDLVRGLNRDYRGQDSATNVLAFESASPSDTGPTASGEAMLLGDVVVAFETARREAGEQGLEFADHVSHLVVHGVLHLLGYDHQNDTEAETMERLETNVLAGLGVSDPYGA